MGYLNMKKKLITALYKICGSGNVNLEPYGPEAKKRIEDPLDTPKWERLIQINRNYEVPWIAGYSEDNKTIYIDRRLPKTFKGHDIARFLVVHEEVEKALRDKLGYDYISAHDIATHAERRAVERAGLNWAHYDDFMNTWIDKLEGKSNPKNQPPDLEDVSTENLDLFLNRDRIDMRVA